MSSVKKIFAVTLFAVLTLSISAPISAAPENMPVILRRFIPEAFAVYDEPNLISAPAETFDPQTVDVVFINWDGWCYINTYLGNKWVNIPATATETVTASTVQESVLLDVPTLDQNELGYPTGCEVTALAMMINYTADADVHTLFTQIPYSDNPLEGFRGDPKSTGGFTIFPPALTEVTEEYLGSFHNMTGGTIKDLKMKLGSETPVVVWVVGFGFSVHAICLTGYDEKGFYYNDPLTGAKNDFITYYSFYEMWNEPIQDKVLEVSYEPRQALSYFPFSFSQGVPNGLTR